MIYLPMFGRIRDVYPLLPKEPLRVVAHLRSGAHVVDYDPICLDSILAWAVVQEATQGAGLPNNSEPYDQPLPLDVLWRDPTGLPLFAATSFYPVGPSATDVTYYHKRSPTGEYSRSQTRHPLKIVSRNGPWMERRIPVPTRTAFALEAFCIGNAPEVFRLLTYLSHIGKRRNTGMGEIASWSVEPVPSFQMWRETDDGRRLTKSIPVDAATAVGFVPLDAPALVGWTPPRWHPSLFRLGWREGTRV